MTDSHSEEVEHAIWRMHQGGEDLKSIANKLKSCDLFISRKLINLAIRRGQLTDRLNSNNGQTLKTSEDDPNLADDVVEEMEIDEADKSKDGVGANITITDEDGLADQLSGVPVVDGTNAHDTEDPDGDIQVQTKSKPRRIKTTDELILRLQEDFRLHPEVKVKERAAKFGIAVGTLCQIKHNILQMPKESGRTWKSTPQMVDAIKLDMQTDPSLKVKERAQKFGISVGTLCRIMHDILALPKRVVQRSGGSRASRVAAQSETAKSQLVAIRKRTKRVIQLPTQATIDLSHKKTSSLPQLCQLQLKSDTDGQVIVVTYDPNSTGQLQTEAGNLTSEIWVMSSSSEVDNIVGDFEAHQDSSVALPETSN